MNYVMVNEKEDIRKKADRYLEIWIRDQLQGDAGYYTRVKSTSSVLAGNFAHRKVIGELKRPTKTRRNPETGELEFLIWKPAQGKERKSTEAITPKWINDIAIKMDKIMDKISGVHADYYLALRLYYQYGSIEMVADQMKCGTSKAKEKKKTGFDMVILLLM